MHTISWGYVELAWKDIPLRHGTENLASLISDSKERSVLFLHILLVLSVGFSPVIWLSVFLYPMERVAWSMVQFIGNILSASRCL